MDSRIDFLHDFKKRVLNGHQAMEPLGESDEDAPYPSPREITGLPEPIPGEAYWTKHEPVPTRSDSGESVSYASSLSGSWCSVEPETCGGSILSKPRTDSKGSSLQDDEERVKINNNRIQLENDDLRFKVDQLNRHIDKLHYENDDCMNRILVLQCSVERADEEVDFYKKLYEATRSKGKDYIERVSPIDGVKKVRYRFGKRVPDPSPTVVDPVVKAMVDERLQPISCVNPEDQMIESENHQEESENKKTLPGFSEQVSIRNNRNIMDEYMDTYSPCTNMDGYSTCKIMKSFVGMDKNQMIVVSSKTEIDQKELLDTYSSIDEYTTCKPMKISGSMRSPLLSNNTMSNTVDHFQCISPPSSADSSSLLLKELTTEREDPTIFKGVQISTKGLNESERAKHEGRQETVISSPREGIRGHSDKHVEEIKAMDDSSSVPLDSCFIGKYTIKDASTVKEAFCYEDSLGKYAKLPPLGAVPNLPTQCQQFKNKKLKPMISCSEGTTYRSEPMPSFPKKMTMPRPTRASAMKAKDTSMKISRNQTLLPKHLPTTDHAVLTGDKSFSLPKIKSVTLTDKNKLQENLKVIKNVNATPLPNLLKPVSTLPRIYKPNPPSIRQTKRPYTGKIRKLPPLN